MTESDLPAVYALSEMLHPHHIERMEVLEEKLRLFPKGCFALADMDGRIRGYCFSHPWLMGPPPALDTLLNALPDRPDVYFIHDIAIDGSARGKNFAATLMPTLYGVARATQTGRTMLVAVSGSTPFWERMGFHRMADATLQAAARTEYGDGAVQMARDVG